MLFDKCNFCNNPLFSFTVCGKYHIYSCGHSPTLFISSVPGELSSQGSTLVNKMSGSIHNLHITVVNHSRNSNHSAVVWTYRIRISTYIALFKAVFSLCSVTLVRNEPLPVPMKTSPVRGCIAIDTMLLESSGAGALILFFIYYRFLQIFPR